MTQDLFYMLDGQHFGCEWCEVELHLTFRLIPGEPMVAYYPDGSGYPGSPAEIDELEVKVIGAGHLDREATTDDISVLQAQLDTILAVDDELMQKLLEYCLERAEHEEADHEPEYDYDPRD